MVNCHNFDIISNHKSSFSIILLSAVFLSLMPQIAFSQTLDFVESKVDSKIFVTPKSGKIVEMILLTGVAATLVLTAKNGFLNALNVY